MDLNSKLTLGLLLSLLTPAAAGVASYYKAMAAVNAEIAQIRADANSDFVKKEVLEVLRVKIDIIANDVSEIKGYLRPRQR